MSVVTAADSAPMPSQTLSPVHSANVLRAPALWWRIAIVLVILVGLFSGSHKVLFFTVQSSAIAAGFFAVAAYFMLVRRTADAPAPRVRGAVTLYLLMTMLISHFVNNDGENPIPGILSASSPEDLLSNRSVFLLHYVAPIMVLLDWLLFGPKGVVRYREALLWLIYPLGYILIVMARAVVLPEASDLFPYGFLDPVGKGYGGVWAWVGGLAVGVIVLSMLLVAIDRGLARLSSKAAARG
ncbi:Pr6Pr family membrane protein [Homoserinimonas hongtaonis]|uniref:Pr6Pr family membrane protein n=1 Tax=Homoserinimonas hongtaonis TaxID=2079791 RepID=UPI0018EF5D47|nr:Pr6Pr family membrane protein [Salinibacterium hongtaonis]